MPRVKRGIVRRAKRKKLSKLTKGYFQNKSKLYKFMKEAAEKAGVYAYVGRKQKKRDYRSLWIVRINAAAREHGVSYSVLMNGLKAAGVTLDRKSLAELAAREPAAFAALVDKAKAAGQRLTGNGRTVDGPQSTAYPSRPADRGRDRPPHVIPDRSVRRHDARPAPLPGGAGAACVRTPISRRCASRWVGRKGSWVAAFMDLVGARHARREARSSAGRPMS